MRSPLNMINMALIGVLLVAALSVHAEAVDQMRIDPSVAHYVAQAE